MSLSQSHSHSHCHGYWYRWYDTDTTDTDTDATYWHWYYCSHCCVWGFGGAKAPRNIQWIPQLLYKQDLRESTGRLPWIIFLNNSFRLSITVHCYKQSCSKTLPQNTVLGVLMRKACVKQMMWHWQLSKACCTSSLSWQSVTRLGGTCLRPKPGGISIQATSSLQSDVVLLQVHQKLQVAVAVAVRNHGRLMWNATFSC